MCVSAIFEASSGHWWLQPQNACHAMHNMHKADMNMLLMHVYLGVAKREVGVFEEDVHMHPSHI